MAQMRNFLPFDAPPPVYVLGVRVDRLTQSQVLIALKEILSSTHASCQQIVTVNPEFVMAAQQNTVFRQCINQAALVLADGIGIVLAARFLRQPISERVTGVDTLVELARLAAEHGYRLYLLGAAPGVAESAGARLQEMVPGVQIAGTYAGSPAPEEENEILERIRIAQADIVCVAYGAPAQDLWIFRNLQRIPASLAMGVGGSFDFLAGRQRRAPQWMRRIGLEWLYRLYREPWRWRRMLALPQFVLQVIRKGSNPHEA